MEKDILTKTAEILTIVSSILVVFAFFGFYKVVDLLKVIRYFRNIKVIKSKNVKMLSIKKTELDSEWDKDYLILNNKKAYWIRNHRTLIRIMQEHPEFTDINIHKEYKGLKELAKFEISHTIDVDWQTI